MLEQVNARKELIAMFYHVSPRKNQASIRRTGIDPAFSRGSSQAIWLVSRGKILWAIAHCAERHGVSIDEMDVWLVPTVKRQRSTRWPGIVSSPCNARPSNCVPARSFLQ